MKKTLQYTISILLIVALLVGCAQGEKNAEKSSAEQGEDPVTVKFFNYKPEVNEQLLRLVEEYEEETGVKVVIETVGGGADYDGMLKVKFNSGDEPDIFTNGGYADLDIWIDKLEDLSDQPWVDHLVMGAEEPMTKDGKIYGMPLNLEGYGFIYNKDLFEEAGITELPKTIAELEEVAKQLESHEITPFVNGYAVWWVLGYHLINVGFAHQDDPNQFIDDLNNNKAEFKGNQAFEDMVRLLDLTLKYGNKNPLQTDYNTEITDFSLGKAAMTQQGDWAQVQITNTNPDINIGFLPMPINDDPEVNDKLFVGVPRNFVINKNSSVKEEAKEFLNWLVNSETGKRYYTEELKFIPAFTNIEAKEGDLGLLSVDIIDYIKENKQLTWNWFKYPKTDATAEKFYSVMQAYVANQITKDEMLEQFKTIWDEDLN